MPGLDLIVRAIRLKDTQVDVISHNISNANTSGFKEERIAFAESENPDNTNLSLPASSTTTPTIYLNFAQGDIVRTDNALDLAIEGKGFFEVQTSEGSAYTRNGSLVLDSEGFLITPAGQKVLGRSGPIRLDGTGDVSISADGTVTQGTETKGNIKIVQFSDPSTLIPAGGNLYKPTGGATGSDVEHPSLLQGSLELSNVSILNNMVQMIDASRQFQAYQKVLNDQSRLDRDAAGSLGRLA
ncbi:MAG: flagellar basal-body rod protein FlgF [Deltaproteobacteria bacterium]|nr:MAG: flagellar basal-body rod protein FlgF [Deltaproteobacteria bacterium]